MSIEKRIERLERLTPATPLAIVCEEGETRAAALARCGIAEDVGARVITIRETIVWPTQREEAV